LVTILGDDPWRQAGNASRDVGHDLDHHHGSSKRDHAHAITVCDLQPAMLAAQLWRQIT
jgi:hypothetical protein